jgi:hypothetical protein
LGPFTCSWPRHSILNTTLDQILIDGLNYLCIVNLVFKAAHIVSVVVAISVFVHC